MGNTKSYIPIYENKHQEVFEKSNEFISMLKNSCNENKKEQPDYSDELEKFFKKQEIDIFGNDNGNYIEYILNMAKIYRDRIKNNTDAKEYDNCVVDLGFLFASYYLHLENFVKKFTKDRKILQHFQDVQDFFLSYQKLLIGSKYKK